jgi:hypothetical protein
LIVIVHTVFGCARAHCGHASAAAISSVADRAEA